MTKNFHHPSGPPGTSTEGTTEHDPRCIPAFCLHITTNNKANDKHTIITSTPTVLTCKYYHIVLFFSMIGRKPKKNWRRHSKIYMSNNRALKNRASGQKCTSASFIPCWSCTVFTHVQKELSTTNGERVKSLNTPEVAFVWQKKEKLTGSQVLSFLLFSRRVEGRNLAGNDSTHHPLLCLELRGYGWPTLSPNFAAHVQKSRNILEVKQHCPKAEQQHVPRKKTFDSSSFVKYWFQWYCCSYWCMKRCATSTTTSANSVFECNISEATRVSKKNRKRRQNLIMTGNQAKGRN